MLKYLFSFILNPVENNCPIALNIKESTLLIINILIYYFGIAIITSLLFLPFLKLYNLLPEPGLPLSAIPLSFKLIVFVPVYEEIIFRLPLKFSKKNISLSLTALLFIFLYHHYNVTTLLGISLIIVIMLYLNLLHQSTFSTVELVRQRWFPFIYYGFALGFGLLHMLNFENLRLAHYLFFPLIVSNQIAMGLLLGYVRVTYSHGFILCVLLHFFINLPLILLSRV
jgi:hypothetical protein